MMHKARSSIKEVPCHFSRSYVKLQSHTAKKSSNLTQIGRFRTVTPVWIHWWISNDTESLMLYKRRALLFFGVTHPISKSHGQKIDNFNPIWVRLLGRSQLSNPSDLPLFAVTSNLNSWGKLLNLFNLSMQEKNIRLSWNAKHQLNAKFQICIYGIHFDFGHELTLKFQSQIVN